MREIVISQAEWDDAHEPVIIRTPTAAITLRNPNSLNIDDIGPIMDKAKEDVRDGLLLAAASEDDRAELGKLPLAFLQRVFGQWTDLMGVEPGESSTPGA